MARKAADQVATIGIDVVCKNSSNGCFGSAADVGGMCPLRPLMEVKQTKTA